MTRAGSTVLYLDHTTTTFDPLPATVYRTEWIKVGGWRRPPGDRPAPTLGRDEVDLLVHRPTSDDTWLYGVRKGTEPGRWMQPAYPPLHDPQPGKTVLGRTPHIPTYPIYDLWAATIYRSVEGTLPGWQPPPREAARCLARDELDLLVHGVDGGTWAPADVSQLISRGEGVDVFTFAALFYWGLEIATGRGRQPSRQRQPGVGR